jgi:CHAT domain-containing protein
LQAARVRIEHAIQDRESLRWQVTRPDLRSTYLASTQDYYDLYIDILMGLHATSPGAGYDRKALQASERARARGLIESLAERSSDVLRGSDPQLLERVRAARQVLNMKDQRLRSLAANNGGAEQIASADRELNAAIAELRDLEGEIRSRNPRYAQLTQPAALSVSALQQQMDDDTVLIEYWLGAKRSFVWTVTKHGMSSHILPAGGTIESAARTYFAFLTTRPVGQGDGNPDATGQAAGQALSWQLLSPLGEALTHRRLVVVRYGALEYIPFAALPVPGWNGAQTQWLIQSHEIINLPAAAVLGALRKLRTQPPSKTIAIFADPVFSADDPRVVRHAEHVDSATGPGSPDAATMLQRSATESGTPTFYRLRYSRLEADAIASLVPPEQRLEALDFEANRAAALSRDITRFRFLHFATHGVLDSVHPELSGLVFSAVDEQGTPQDAMVRLHEIFQMSLRADLVVLSACQTAVGREIRGEGLVGLTRGFMYAGARRVVATLWNVNDRATAEFMMRFYEGVLRDRLTVAVSLRAAQLALLQDPRWSSPYYWGGIVLQGDWN